MARTTALACRSMGIFCVLVTAAPAYAEQGPAVGVAQRAAPAPAAQAAPKVVEEGLFPKSFRIPGTDVSLAIGGYVKVDYIQDFDAIGDAFEFKPNSIPARGTTAALQSGRTTIHARETRFNVDLRSPGSGGHAFRAFAEGDFFGDGNAFRMRHAYGEFGPILGGQTWSTFQDISARGLTVDFEGPDGEVFVRQPMIRVNRRINQSVTVAIAAENPSPQFAVPAQLIGAPRATMPDIPGFVRFQRGGGHVQVSGLVRQLRFDSTTEATADTSTVGWGVNTTFVLPVGRDQLLGQFAIGEGVGRYIEGLSGQSLDAVLSATGELNAVRAQSGNLSFIHYWKPVLKSGLSLSTSYVDDRSGLPATSIERIMDLRGNLFWSPYRLVDFAGELLWGQRTNRDGSEGDAVRFQFAVIYRLN